MIDTKMEKVNRSEMTAPFLGSSGLRQTEAEPVQPHQSLKVQLRQDGSRLRGCIAQRKHSCFPPSSPGIESRLRQHFSLDCIVSGQFCDQTHLVLSNGFHKCSQGWHPELSSTKKLGPVLELALCLTKNAFLRWGRHRVSICTSHPAALGSMLVAPSINWASLLRPRTAVVN